MIFDFIKNHEKIFPIEKMCKVLKVSQSGYYRWKNRILSKRIRKKNLIKEKITAIYFESKQRYGSPRPENSARTGEVITIELNVLGLKISRITIAKYTKELGLRSKLSKKFKVTTDSKHSFLMVENVLNRQFIVAAPSKVWVSDITYLYKRRIYLLNNYH